MRFALLAQQRTLTHQPPSSQVIGGSVNQAKGWNMVVEADCASYVERIIKSVQEAQLNRAPIELYADRISSIFAPTIIAIAALTFLVWLSTGHTVFMSFLRSISVVVVACPCALGLATPTAVMVGCGVGAKEGLLIRGGAVLEAAQKATCVVFDKTGTLTLGSLAVTASYTPAPLPEATLAFLRGLFPSTVALQPSALAHLLAATAEQGSEHPVAKAIVQTLPKRPHAPPLPTCDDFKVFPGQGVSCNIGGRAVRVGKASWLNFQGKCMAAVELDGSVIGCFNIHDEVRPGAPAVVSDLQARGVQVYICTGDESEAAARVANECGIKSHNVFTGVMPDEKGEVVANLQREGEQVVFVGDGINDAVALTKANVGIGVGGGTSIAIESADVVLMRDGDLNGVVATLDLAKVVFDRIRLNFLWATMYNFVSLPIASGILYPWTGWTLPPAFAGLAMACSSVTVVCSSLLLKTYRRPASSGGADQVVGARPEFKEKKLKRGHTEELGLLEAGRMSDSGSDELEMTALQV